MFTDVAVSVHGRMVPLLFVLVVRLRCTSRQEECGGDAHFTAVREQRTRKGLVFPSRAQSQGLNFFPLDLTS